MMFSSERAFAQEAPIPSGEGFYNAIYFAVTKNAEKEALKNLQFDSDLALGDAQRQLVDFRPISDADTQDQIYAQIALISRYNFEKELADLKAEVQGVVTADELFSNGVLEDIPGLPKFDLLRDLDTIDFLLFGTSQTINLPSGQAGSLDDFVQPLFADDRSSESLAQDSDLSSPTAGLIINKSLGVNDRDIVSGGLSSSSAATSSEPKPPITPELLAECSLKQSVSLDNSYAQELESAEKALAHEVASSLSSPSTSIRNTYPTLDFSTVTLPDISSQIAVKDSVLNAKLREANANPNEKCFQVDFDIEFCISAEFGNYPAAKVYKTDSCISCMVKKINSIFETKLLPYSLRAHKNDGQIAAGGFCTGALDPEPGVQVMFLPKPVPFENTICPKVSLQPEREQVASRQLIQLKIIKDLKVKMAAETDETKRSTLKNAIKDQKLIMLNDLVQWQKLKSNYELQTGCVYPVGEPSADKSFDSIIKTYEGPAGTDQAKSNDANATDRLLGLDPSSLGQAFDAISLNSEQDAKAKKQIMETLKKALEEEQKIAEATQTSIRMKQMVSYFDSISKAISSLGDNGEKSIINQLKTKQ